ncbi:hypothetical protein VPH35_029473 [Triticum aestivum]
MSPTACYSVSVHEDDINNNDTYTMEVPMTKDDMFLTNLVLPAVSHVYPLKLFVDRQLQAHNHSQLHQGPTSISSLDGWAIDSILSSLPCSPDGCSHRNKTQLLIGIYVASSDSPRDPEQQASMSLLGVGVTKNSSNDNVKDNQNLFSDGRLSGCSTWNILILVTSSSHNCVQQAKKVVFNALESTQASTHVFCHSRKKVVPLVTRQLSIPESDASILLLEGLPRSSIHLTVGSSSAGSAC